MKPFYESHQRRPIYLLRTAARLSPFLQKVKSLPSKAVLRVHGRRHQCSSRQCKSPPSNVFLLECRSVVAQCVERLQHFKRPRFVMIPAPVIRSLPSIFFENSRRPDSLPTKAHALITNLLSLIRPSVHLIKSGTRPSCLSTKATKDDHP